MNEIDFDELDKAVSSLMSKATVAPASNPGTEPAAKQADTSTSAMNVGNSNSQSGDETSDKAERTLDLSNMSAMPAPTAMDAPAPAPAPAIRRGGRFFDIVRPSADTKLTSAETPSAVKKTTLFANPPKSRLIDGITARPNTALPMKQQPASVPAKITPDNMPTSVPVPEQDDNFSATQPTKELLLSGTEQPELAPLVSPFLSNTKVEKRPLGGMQPEPDTAGATAPPPPEVPSSPQVSQPPRLSLTPSTPEEEFEVPPQITPQMPEEFSSDLVAIESGSGVNDTDAAASHSDVVSPDTQPPVVPPVQKPPVTTEPPIIANRPTGPTSIPQQYKEVPSTGDQSNGAIFDTTNYHQPLAHPAKKHSGWSWIIWIVLILIVGAVGGAVAYYFGVIAK